MGETIPLSDLEEDAAVKYMLLINLGPRARDHAALDPEQQRDVAAAWEAVRTTPGVTPGQWLQPPETATTVRVSDGQVLTTDGPYVETREALDSFCILEADDLDAAIELAARMPAATMGGAVEIRPIVEWSAQG